MGGCLRLNEPDDLRLRAAGTPSPGASRNPLPCAGEGTAVSARSRGQTTRPTSFTDECTDPAIGFGNTAAGAAYPRRVLFENTARCNGDRAVACFVCR